MASKQPHIASLRAHHRRGRSDLPDRRRWTGLLALAQLLGLAGCVVPAPEEPVLVTPPKFLMIDPGFVDPSPAGVTPVNRGEVAGKQFEIGVPLASEITTTVRYFWYYDYDPGGPGPEFYSLCANSDDKCVLRVCLRPNSQENIHQMLVVIADQKLNPAAKHPFDFPKGTSVDAVQWTLKLTGNCP